MATETTVAQTDPEVVPVPDQNQDGLPPVCKSRLFTWRLLGAVLALLVVLGWVFIIVMLILEEKWQLVLVAWLLLYSAAHFCYWYCKRHSILTLHRRQIRLRVLARVRSGDGGEKSEDAPPTYAAVMDDEVPPPAYHTVIHETTKPCQASPPAPPAAAPEPTPCEEPPAYTEEVSTTIVPVTTTDVEGVVPTVSAQVHQAASAMEYLPKYHTPRHMRKLSPRVLPGVHQLWAPTDTAVTTTAAATAIATAAAALTAAVPNEDTETQEEEAECPIRGPVVRHLRAATMATLEVSQEQDLTPVLSRKVSTHSHNFDPDEEIDLQAPPTPPSGAT